MAHLQLTGLRKSFRDGTEALRDVSFDVQDREAVFLLGPSGAGKTTTLRLVAGLEDADAGTIGIGRRDVTNLMPRDRNVAMVYDKHSLFPHLSVRENLAYPLRIRRMGQPEIDRRIVSIADTLQIGEQLDKMPRQLSGGQQQRVAIGRALVRDADVFLLDEPISHLDAQLRARMRLEFKRLQRDFNATMLYVSHDQLEAMTMADRIVLINGGRIEQIDRPQDLFDRPQTIFGATFIGEPAMNILPANLVERDGKTFLEVGSSLVAIDGGWVRHGGDALSSNEEYAMGVRPQQLQLAAPGEAAAGVVQGKVFAIEVLGSRVVFDIELGTSLVRVLTTVDEARRHSDRIGAPAAVRIDPAYVYLFSKRTGRTVRQARFTEARLAA
jgi:ABC-type sugar transport system ATPase subunit